MNMQMIHVNNEW